MNKSKIQLKLAELTSNSLNDVKFLKDLLTKSLKGGENFSVNEKNFSFTNEHFTNEWYYEMKELFENKKVNSYFLIHFAVSLCEILVTSKNFLTFILISR